MVPVAPIEQRPASELAQLQGWYLGSLRPKLVGAAHAGTVAPAAVANLDELLRKFLDLGAEGSGTGTL